jgi:hypothetical protein
MVKFAYCKGSVAGPIIVRPIRQAASGVWEAASWRSDRLSIDRPISNGTAAGTDPVTDRNPNVHLGGQIDVQS